MSPLEVLQLVGYSTAAALHLWVGALLLKRRHGLGPLERVLMILAWAVGAFHACNLILTLHAMLGFDVARWKSFLRLTNSLGVVGITLSYSLLLHVHLYLWANAKKRGLTRGENLRVYLSYLPVIFLTVAVWKLWREPYAPMYEKLAFLLLPFALWAAYSLCVVAVTDFLIARRTSSASERRLLQTLGASFVGIAALIFSVYVLQVGRGTQFGLYLQTTANLGSLVPTALLAYHIYRYRYLELIIKESLIVATFAAVILAVYVYGIRTVGEWLTARYDLRPGIVESMLILTLALVAAPLRNWLDRRFHRLFQREAALYRDVVTSIGANAGRYNQLPDLLRFVEERITTGLRLGGVRIVSLNGGAPAESDNPGDLNALGQTASNMDGRAASEAERMSKVERASQVERVSRAGKLNRVVAEAAGLVRDDVESFDATRDSVDVVDVQGATASEKKWERAVLDLSRTFGYEPVEGAALLRERGYEIAYPLRREEREVGLMLVEAAPDALTHDVRAVLEVLAGQVAVAIEDCRLVAKNVGLERRLAQRERLAALGQMAATVAHEIKNPLSAIKSIVQVMREDESLGRDYARDLELIVGETDRLNRSVSQMLNFARSAPPPDAPRRLGELVGSVAQLFQAEAGPRGVRIDNQATDFDAELDGASVSALRDALSNLLLNALHASSRGGVVRIEARGEQNDLTLAVVDAGPGVPPELAERIWEPFYTTKQRGTGLGLSIVRKRMEEIGGTARLSRPTNGEGARFELTLPLPRAARQTLTVDS